MCVLSGVEYLQSLCILYPEKKIWGSYQLLRSQQVTTLIQDLLTPSYSDESITQASEPRQPVTLDLLAMRLPKLVECLQCMIEEDFAVMLSNVFDGQVRTNFLQKEAWIVRDQSFISRNLRRATNYSSCITTESSLHSSELNLTHKCKK